jgi:hypothetical protein
VNCPRCSAGSLVVSHAAVSCLSCGHAVNEKAHEAWDKVSSIRGGSRKAGPAWTEAERALWSSSK